MQLKLSQAYLALDPEQVLDVNFLFVSFRLNLDEELLNWKQRVNALLEEAALVLKNLLAYILICVSNGFLTLSLFFIIVDNAEFTKTTSSISGFSSLSSKNHIHQAKQ